MNKNYRTQKTVFDMLISDCENDISEKITDYENADCENVKSLTYAKLGTDKNTDYKRNKKNKHRFAVSLIAAVLALTLLGTVMVGASETFTASFSEYIAGEPAKGVFTGGNVQKHSDTADIDFHGVTGDEHTAAVSMTFSAKDGETFIDDDIIKDKDNLIVEFFSEYRPFDDDWYTHDEGWYYGYGICKYNKQYYDCTIPANHSLINFMAHRRDNDGLTACEYTFRDNKTIDLYAEYYNESSNIKGQRLSLGLENLYVSHIDKVLYTEKDFNDFEEWEKFRTDSETYKMLNEKYKDSLKDNQSVRIVQGWNKIVIATKYEVPLNYNVSVSLNYRTVNRNLIDTEKNIIVDGKDYRLCSMTAGSLSMEMKIQTGYDMLENDSFFKSPFEQLIIRLKDGKVIAADIRSSSGGSIDRKEEYLVIKYSYYEKEDLDRGIITRFALDPENIISIELDGQILYKS